MNRLDYCALADAAAARGWATAIEEAVGPGARYGHETADHCAAPALMALPAADGVALDVRCGLGSQALALAAVCRTLAADPDPHALRLLKLRLDEPHAAGRSVECVPGDPVDSLPAGSVDLLLTRYHDRDRLQHLSALVSRGGRVLFGTPNPWSPLRRRSEGRGIGLRRASALLAGPSFRLAAVYGAWRSVEDVRLLFETDRRSRRRAARESGLPVAGIGSFLIPAYWIVWERTPC